MEIKKNGLTLEMQADGSYVCRELQNLPTTFSERYNSDQVQAMIDAHLAFIRDLYELRVEDDSEESKLSEGAQKTRASGKLA